MKGLHLQLTSSSDLVLSTGVYSLVCGCFFLRILKDVLTFGRKVIFLYPLGQVFINVHFLLVTQSVRLSITLSGSFFLH